MVDVLMVATIKKPYTKPNGSCIPQVYSIHMWYGMIQLYVKCHVHQNNVMFIIIPF